MVVLQHTHRVRKVSLVLVNHFRPSGGPSRLHKVWKHLKDSVCASWYCHLAARQCYVLLQQMA